MASSPGAAPRPEVPPRAPGASRGLAAPEVTAATAIAAGLTWQGVLAQETPLRLYYLAAAAQAAGRLTLAAEKGAYALTFKKGTPEHAHSTYPEDDLGKFLIRRGILGSQQVAEAQAVQVDFGGELIGALLGLRMVNAADLFRTLQEYGVALIWRALAAESRSGRWEPGIPPPPSSFPIGAPWSLFCDAVRRIDVTRVRLRLGCDLTCSALRVGGRIALETLRLTPQETRLCGLFDGVRSIEEIVATRPSEIEVVLRLGLLLRETELLAFGAERGIAVMPPPSPAAAASAPATAPSPVVEPPSTAHTAVAPKASLGSATSPSATSPRPVASHSPGSPSRPPAASAPSTARPPVRPAVSPAGAPQPSTSSDLMAMRELATQLVDADFFQILNVKRDASTAQIKIAYFQLAKRYHPDTGSAADSPEMRQLRADIFTKVGEAWGVLGNDQQRTEYRQQLESGGVKEVDVSAIFEAEKLFEMAMVLVKTRQYEEAAKKLDEAIQFNANEPEFGVWKAWVAFLLAPEEKKASQQRASINTIEAALHQNPKCLPGYLFLGQMAKLVGDTTSAEKHFKRGLEQNPDHVELQRELKYLRKK